MTRNTYSNTLFIDSGAHGLYNEFVIKKKIKRDAKENKYAWYGTTEFWDYVDTYAKFIKENKTAIDIFANVDVIFNPEMTWEVQLYMEKKYKIIPLPTIHFGTDLIWLEKYLKRGYEYIALGGLGQEAQQNDYIKWADKAYHLICDPVTHLPKVKVHGFAMTSHRLMSRYPWYSVDSTS